MHTMKVRKAIWVCLACGSSILFVEATTAQSDNGTNAAENTAVDDASSNARRLTPEAIAYAVESELRADPFAELEDVDATVSGGTVRLVGSVASLLAKERATLIAETLRGVNSVENTLDPSRLAQTHWSDSDKEQRIKGALVLNPVTEAFDINIDVARGIATLTGQADSWHERAVADDIAATIRGINEVDNDLVVATRDGPVTFNPYVDGWSNDHREWSNPSPNCRRSDEVIATAVRNQLWWSPFVDEDDIEVSVRAGVVTLSSQVGSRAERAAASLNALEAGARRVDNRVAVLAE